MSRQFEDPNPLYEVNAETMAADYLLGKYEIEKLKQGFKTSVQKGEPCRDQNSME